MTDVIRAAGFRPERRRVQCATCPTEFERDVVVVEGRVLGASVARCPECLARVQAEIEAERAAAEAERVQQMLEHRRLRALEELSTPPLYAHASLATFMRFGSTEHRVRQDRALTLVRRYLAGWPDVQELLLFSGGPGTGKGHLLWTIARHLAGVEGIRGRVVKLADLVREIRASWRDRTAESEAAVLTRYRALPWLAIDEVSRHAFYGQQIHQHLYDVVDHRIEQGRPTVLTTNEPDDVVADILGPALLDRLQGSGGLVEFGQESWRSRSLHDD